MRWAIGLLATVTVLWASPSPLWARNQLKLAWEDRSSDEDGFWIGRGPAMPGSFSEIATVAANLTTYTDTDRGLVAGAVYCHRVRRFNGGGDSGYTNARCGVAGAKE